MLQLEVAQDLPRPGKLVVPPDPRLVGYFEFLKSVELYEAETVWRPKFRLGVLLVSDCDRDHLAVQLLRYRPRNPVFRCDRRLKFLVDKLKRR